MTPQQANYFARLLDLCAQLAAVLEDMPPRIQEAYDRGYDQIVSQIEFEGDLDHLTPQNLGNLLTTAAALETLMTQANRQHWKNLRAVLR